MILWEGEMPRKRDYDRSYGQKLITLFSRLLFSGESYSLTQLSEMLECSKQSVKRLVDDISRSYHWPLTAEMRGNKLFFGIQRPKKFGATLALSERELQLLEMCQVFTAHLLGADLYEESARALWKSRELLSEGKRPSSQPFGSFRSAGSIDYTPHQDIIRNFIQAMDEKKICKVSYQAIMENKPKTYYLKPLKLFSHQGTVYLHAQRARFPEKPYKKPDYDPLLAIHRFKKVELDDRSFEVPSDYDFEKTFNNHFGIMKDEVFPVKVEFTGWSARYISERIWSPDQKISKKGKDKIQLSFRASSSTEIISWLFSFGEEAKLLEPDWLVEEVVKKITMLNQNYN
jgi:predicted DNA-binding transcriptional regulator YafY